MSDDIINQDELDAILNPEDPDEGKKNSAKKKKAGRKPKDAQKSAASAEAVNQDDIDAMFNLDGPAEESAAAAKSEAPSNEAVNQDDIDAMFNLDGPAEEPAAAAKSEAPSNEAINQDDIDAMFNLDGPAEEPAAAAKSEAENPDSSGESIAIEDSGAIISQDEIDLLLGVSSSVSSDSHHRSEKAEERLKNLQGKSSEQLESSSIISQDEIDLLISTLTGGSEQPVASTPAAPSTPVSPPTQAAKPAQPPKEPEKSDTKTILSQNDIDALIDSIGSSDNSPAPVSQSQEAQSSNLEQEKTTFQIPAAFIPQEKITSKRYRLYDFRRPDKLSRDQVRRIKSFFEPMPRHLTNYFAKMMKTHVEVELIDIDQRNYGDVFKASSTPTIISIFSMGSNYPTGIIEFSTHMFYSILERMMGGNGTSVTPIRPLTEFEKYLLGDILNQILIYYRDMLGKMLMLDPRIELIETDGQLIPKTLSENEVLVRNVFVLRINGLSGYLNISIPYNIIGPLFARYNTSQMPEHHEKVDFSKFKEKKSLRHLLVPVSVEFSKKKIRAIEAVTLAPGSIISLDHNQEKALGIRVNGKLKYFGLPCMRGNKVAVKVTSTIEDEG